MSSGQHVTRMPTDHERFRENLFLSLSRSLSLALSLSLSQHLYLSCSLSYFLPLSPIRFVFQLFIYSHPNTFYDANDKHIVGGHFQFLWLLPPLLLLPLMLLLLLMQLPMLLLMLLPMSTANGEKSFGIEARANELIMLSGRGK